ncbi:hypothetical protein F4861DRAFT_491996 [Xylaria intraflava]|nr:hypothetical protein F4861DRAFT_491996 [Xylaria intraflava]
MMGLRTSFLLFLAPFPLAPAIRGTTVDGAVDGTSMSASASSSIASISIVAAELGTVSGVGADEETLELEFVVSPAPFMVGS